MHLRNLRMLTKILIAPNFSQRCLLSSYNNKKFSRQIKIQIMVCHKLINNQNDKQNYVPLTPSNLIIQNK